MSDSGAVAHAGNCSEKQRLLESYREAAAEYRGALAELNSRIGLLSRSDYTAEHRVIEAIQLRAEKARKALDRHVSEHGCR